MALKVDITNAMKGAMRARQKDRLKTIRLILSEIKRVEVDERIDIDDSRLVSILAKMIKQRRDSISQYDQAGRTELSEIESNEIEVINEFLPAALSDDEINELIQKAIAETSASSMKDMGKVMGALKSKHSDTLDFSKVSSIIKKLLG